jgi:hypothetical protein
MPQLQMLEHMKNYEALFKKMSTWLRDHSEQDSAGAAHESLIFIHVFCHKQMPYHYEDEDGWMAQKIFSGTNVVFLFLKACLLIRLRRNYALVRPFCEMRPTAAFLLTNVQYLPSNIFSRTLLLLEAGS